MSSHKNSPSGLKTVLRTLALIPVAAIVAPVVVILTMYVWWMCNNYDTNNHPTT